MTGERERQWHLQHDHMSGNWSFGSNYHPHGQSRKISIGVVANSPAQMKSKSANEGLVELQTSENVTSAKNNPSGKKPKRKEVMSPDMGKQNKAPHQEPSPGVWIKNSYQNISDSDAICHQKKVSSWPSTINVLLEPSDRNIVGETEPIPFFANQVFDLHAGNANEKRVNKNRYQSEGGSHGIMDREEEFSHATEQKVLVPEKEITEQGTSERRNGNVTLRMKVQELLGTVYSPNKKQYDSRTLGMDAHNLKQKSKISKNDSPVAMHRQYLDTGTNSGGLDKNRRPVSRSLTCKKPHAQKSAPRKPSSFCQYKQACLDETEFSFLEAWSRRLGSDVDHAFTMCKRKEKEISETGPVKTCFLEGDHKNESQQATDGRKRKAAAKNVSLHENGTGGCEMVKLNNEVKEKAPHQFEVIMTRHQPGGTDGPVLYDSVDQETLAKHSLTNNMDPQYELNSPAFELKTATEISCPKSLLQINQEDLDVDSPAGTAFKTKGIHSFHSTGYSTGVHYSADTKNLGMDLQDSPVVRAVSLSIGGHKENRCSRSPSKEVQSENYEDGSPVTVPITLENNKGNRWSTSSSEAVDSESCEDGSPMKEDEDYDKFHDSPEQDGLAGAVKLFSLALERVQSKIHSMTNRQSAEILSFVFKNINCQLQNAESKIRNDVGKLTSVGKSKRMRPENQCQEQREQLKRIYEKFKEEVDQHLENCRSTLEGLEAHQIEVRGMVEKQRLSHRKLLLQTEEAIETQLNDAQRRLSDVHRFAREKMLKLKNGIGECLKGSLLG